MIQANHISHVSPWGCRYAESIGATHFVTSAKLNTGIHEVFLDVACRKCSSHNFALCAIYTCEVCILVQISQIIIFDGSRECPFLLFCRTSVVYFFLMLQSLSV
jgi:hypothetical protein